MSIPYTRAMVTAAIEGLLDNVEYELDRVFNVYVPTSCPGVPSEILNPRNTWADKTAYDKQASNLAGRFAQNFSKFSGYLHSEVAAAGPMAGMD